MDHRTSHNWKLLMLAGATVSLLAWPGTSEAQTVTGQASAVQATVFGMTTAPPIIPNRLTNASFRTAVP